MKPGQFKCGRYPDAAAQKYGYGKRITDQLFATGIGRRFSGGIFIGGIDGKISELYQLAHPK